MPDARNVISVQINDHAHFITFVMRGVLYGSNLLDVTEQAYRGLAEPWRYHRLYDIRAFINLLQVSDFSALVDQWPKLAGRQAPMRWAILTNDAVRVARAVAFGPLFPDLTVRTFDTMAEAIAWLVDDITPDQATLG